MRCTMNGVICAGTMPTVTSGVPICAAFSAMTQSATATSPTPPPMHAPSTSAISALGNVSAISRNAPKRRLEAAVDSVPPPCAASDFCMPLKSPPAQKLPPAPISTRTRTPSSSRAWANTCPNSASICGDSALRTSGRLSVTFVTGPSRSTISVSWVIGHSSSLRRSPSPRSSRGEGRGEGRQHTPASALTSAPHPSPLPF